MRGKKHWSMNIYFTEVFVSWAELSWTHVPTFFFVYTHTSEKTPTNGLSKDSDHDNNHGSLIPQRRCWRVNILLCGPESSHSSPGCTPLLYILYIGYFFGAEIRMERTSFNVFYFSFIPTLKFRNSQHVFSSPPLREPELNGWMHDARYLFLWSMIYKSTI